MTNPTMIMLRATANMINAPFLNISVVEALRGRCAKADALVQANVQFQQ